MKSNGWARFARVSLLSIACVGAVGGAAFAEDAAAASTPPASERRWLPGASFFTTGHVDQRKARMSADTPITPGEPDLGINGESVAILWSFGGTLDISTPVLLDIPGRPRLFAHADVGYTYDQSDPVTTRGDPGVPPTLPDSQGNVTSVQNAGASIRIESKPLVFSGGVGTVFEFEAFERGFRVRPTLEWMYRRDTMRVLLGSGETEAATGTACVPTCRTLFIEAQTEKGFHSIGPGLEVETDVGRAGDFLVGWYGSFRAYRLVGDDKANMNSVGSWKRLDGQPTTRPDTTFFTQYEREPWSYRFGMGIRIVWSPEE